MKALPRFIAVALGICAAFIHAAATEAQAPERILAVDFCLMEQGQIDLSLQHRSVSTQLWHRGSDKAVAFSETSPIRPFDFYTGYSVQIGVTEAGDTGFDLKVAGYASILLGFTEYESGKFTPLIESRTIEGTAYIAKSHLEHNLGWHALPILDSKDNCIAIIFYRLRNASEADIAEAKQQAEQANAAQ